MARTAPITDPAAVLLLHGQPGTAADWHAVSDVLHRTAPGLATLAIDRPGWGQSSAPAGDLHANAAAALKALDAARVQRAIVVGHSFGGAVAAWLAAGHPDRVAALVLVAPAANRASLVGFDRFLALPLAGFLASTSLMAGAGATLAVAPARRLLAGPLHVDDRLLDQYGRAFRSPSVWTSFAREQQTLVKDLPVLERVLKRIFAPTTIVIGDQDDVVPPHSARRLRDQIPGAELIEIPGARHLIPFQQAGELAALINERRPRKAGAPTAAPARARTRARRTS